MRHAHNPSCLLIRILAVVFLAGWMLTGIGCGRAPKADETTTAPTLSSLCEKPFGREHAPIQVQAFLPLNNGCQDSLGLYLVDLAQKHPDVFRVEVLDMKSERGHATMVQNGIRCAAVRINSRTSFDLPQPTGKILLEGPMDPLDVYHALLQVLDAEGTTVPEGLPRPVIPEGVDKLRALRQTSGIPRNAGGEK